MDDKRPLNQVSSGDTSEIEKPRSSSITVGDIVNSVGVAIGPGASVNITLGIGELPVATRYDGLIQSFLEYYLGTKKGPAPFGGRAQDLDALDAWLNDPSAPPYAALIAPAGRGKSALLAHWITRLMADEAHAPHIVYFPISIRFGTNLETVAFASLAARMAHLYGEKVTQALDVQQYCGVFADYMRRAPSDGRPVLVVIDGLDEAAGWDIGAGLFPITPTSHLRVLIAARPLAGDADERTWLSRLGWDVACLAKPLSLGGLDRAGVADVLLQMGNPLDKLATKIDVVGKLHELSEGDPLLVGLYVEALLPYGDQGAMFTPEDLLTLEPGLGAYFQRWFDEQRKLWGTANPLRDKSVRAFLNLLAVALGPLRKSDVLALASNDEIGEGLLLNEAMYAVRRFIIGDGVTTAFVFSHPRLGEFFTDQMSKHEYQAWQTRFLKYGKETLSALRDGTLVPRNASAYVVGHYGPHLIKADASNDDVYALMCEPWLQAWQWIEGTPAGFLNDTQLAWRRAEASDADAIGKQMLAALCFSSVVSLSQNVHIELLQLCVKSGVLSLPLGLVLARQKTDPKDRALCLIAIAKHMIPNDSNRVLQEAVEVAKRVENEDFRIHILCELTEYLPEDLLADVWAAASLLNEESHIARLIISLAEKAPRDLVDELSAVRSSIQDIGMRALVSVALADGLPNAELRSTVTSVTEAAHTSSNKHLSTAILAAISQLDVEKESTLLSMALDIAYQILPEDNRASALCVVARNLPEPERTNVFSEALNCVAAIQLDNDRLDTFEEIVSSVPEGLPESALATARTFRNEYSLSHAYALVSVASRLNEQQRRSVLNEALEAAGAFQNEYGRADILAKMAGHLPYDLVDKALNVANTIGYKPSRADALAALAMRLPRNKQQKQAQDAFNLALGTWDRYSVSIALGQLSCLLPSAERSGLFVQAISAAVEIDDANQIAAAVVALSKLAPHEHLDRLATIARGIKSASERARALAGVAAQLSAVDQRSVLSESAIAAHSIVDPYERARFLCSILPNLSEQECASAYSTIVRSAHEIRNLYFRALTLGELAKHIPEHARSSLLTEVLYLAEHIGDARDFVLIDTAEFLPEHLVPLALNLANSIAAERERSNAWSTIAKRLPVDQMDRVLAHVSRFVHDDAKSAALRILSSRIPVHLAAEARSIAETIQDSGARITALSAIAPRLQDDLKRSVMDEALTLAPQITTRPFGEFALSDLVENLPENRIGQSLDLIRAIPYEDARTRVLAAAVSRLPDHLLYEALQIMYPLCNATEVDKVLSYLAAHWVTMCAASSRSEVDELSVTLHAFAKTERRQLLKAIEALAPVIYRLGGEQAIRETAQAIIDTGHWWP